MQLKVIYLGDTYSTSNLLWSLQTCSMQHKLDCMCLKATACLQWSTLNDHYASSTSTNKKEESTSHLGISPPRLCNNKIEFWCSIHFILHSQWHNSFIPRLAIPLAQDCSVPNEDYLTINTYTHIHTQTQHYIL